MTHVALTTDALTGTVVLILASCMTVLLMRQLPRWWRNERGLHADTVPAGWPWGDGVWRSYVRLIPTCALFFIVGVPGVLLTSVATPGSVLNDIGVALDTLAFVGVIVGLVGVPLFNRPKFLIAPHLRDQPGLIAELRGKEPIPTPPPWRSPRRQPGDEVGEPRPRLSWLPDDLRERHERELDAAGRDDDDARPMPHRPSPR